MNVYDFDNTVYYGDSTRDFYFFCLKRHLNILLYLPYQAFWAVPFFLRILEKTRFKEKFYIFFKGIGDIDAETEDFWKSHEGKIKDWYLKQKKDSDIIISASPEFLLRPVCEKLGVRLIASRVDRFTGKYTGKNCYGEEKVKRFCFETEGEIDSFYSDSYSDAPLAKLAKRAFLVKGDEIINW